ncbi:fungal-specific transcription factor domain-containing protein [Aspergillus crustosus]
MASHAAAHLSITYLGSGHERARFRSIYQHLRDLSLRILNERMRSGLPCDLDIWKGSSFSIDVLASTLLLCYADAFIPGSTEWKLHLRACQAVISSRAAQCQPYETRNTTEAFLLKEVADLEILSGLSVFSQRSTPITDSFPHHLHTESPWTFTKLIDEVTTLERRRHESLRYGLQVPEPQMQIWHQRAEDAYFGVLDAIGSFLEQQQQSGRRCLETVVLTHHHALVLYSHQALAPLHELDEAVDLFWEPLLSCIQSVIEGPDQRFSHDLFIPLFSLGTECRRSRDR